MRLTTLLIGIQACFVTILLATGIKAQSITLVVQQADIKQVFNSIEKQSGFAFTYNEQTLQGLPGISLKVINKPLADVLKNISQQLPLQFKQSGSLIGVIRRSEEKKSKLSFASAPYLKDITGRVTDTTGAPIVGATIKVQGSSLAVSSGFNGQFTLHNVPSNGVVVISFIGYKTQEVVIGDKITEPIIIILKESSSQLNQVAIVSTGFQQINKERATGSFTQIDNQLYERRVSTNIIDRLEGVTSGLIFNRNYNTADPNSSAISIRGLSTIYANTKPLIVVDNFPTDGDISNINPNDVENITILKDAAAASIWGARSGNGVIVITTKKGKLNNPLKVQANTNYTVTIKPNIFYSPNFLDASDFIDFEKTLFGKGFYDASISSTTHPIISPVVEILAQQRSGLITSAQSDAQINALRSNDIRSDLSKYLYRSSGTQQYALNMSGGNAKMSYYLSAGYDNVPSAQIGNTYDRLSLNNSISAMPLRNLEVIGAITYTSVHVSNNNPGTLFPGGSKGGYYPYARIADDNGNPLALPKDYRYSYINAPGNNQLLDWTYKPLDELDIADNTSKETYIKFNTGIKYTFLPGLSIDAKYQLEEQLQTSTNLQNQAAYYTRNLINLYSQVSGTTITRPIPLGGIFDVGNNNLTNNSFRAQVNFFKALNAMNNLAVIAGIDAKQVVTNLYANRLYGYNGNIEVSSPVDYVTVFSSYQALSNGAKIPYANSINKLTDEYFSYFANASYTYNERYILSGSARLDQSNLFGVNTNQKSVPLWSAGIAWELSKENFYKINWLPYLKLRATYGYNGNIDKTVSAYTTAIFSSNGPINGAPYASIQNPPNPDLRWERIGLLNFGLDFESKNRKLSGSLEYYQKNGEDILGFAPTDPTVGVTQFKGNVANITGNGTDVDITFRTGEKLQWQSSFLLSKATNKVTQYNRQSTVGAYLQAADGTAGTAAFIPIVGKPIYGVYSYKWAGLDPTNGDPQGYLNGQVTKDYSTISTSKNLNDLVYNGPAQPTVFGGLRNTFSYKNISLSLNITYKLGYYFRRPSINYSNLASWSGNIDYTLRWQKSGDEQTTNVPSFLYPFNTARENFYTYSEVLVEKGDHIRLQDMTLSYDLSRLLKKSAFHSLQIYGYANNIGILWKATKTTLDPDYVNNIYVSPKTFSLGLKSTF